MDKESKPIRTWGELGTAVLAGCLLAWAIVAAAGCKIYVCDTAPNPAAPRE